MSTSTMPLKAPDLSDNRVMRVVAGLRPCRQGGLRLAGESIGGKRIVHHYGHGGSGITSAFGSSIVAADLAQESLSSDRTVAVLGGGIAGLTAARELVSRGYTTKIYAERFGIDTLSNLAGALWLPTGINLDTPEIGLNRFNTILRDAREKLALLDPKKYGIEILPVYEPAYAPIEHRFFEHTSLTPPRSIDRLPFPGPPRAGKVFETLFIHTPKLLDALLADLKGSGVEFVERSFGSIDDVLALDEPTIVNSLALGSRTIFGDDSMFPAKGVLVHVEPQDLGYCAHDGYKYMFPRSDALVLGGCFIEDEWDDTPDESIAREILSHHRRFFGLI